MDKKVIELLDSALTLSTLALMIAQRAINNDEAKEVALNYMDDAVKEIWEAHQTLREILRVQDFN